MEDDMGLKRSSTKDGRRTRATGARPPA